jgi:predicted GIY-YIG superfamily endonuclease
MIISNYTFEGPYPLLSTNFSKVGAVYVISDNKNAPIDVGQTDDLRDRMGTHERKPCWQRNAQGGISVYALVEASEKSRLFIEQKIRNAHKFTCGVQ